MALVSAICTQCGAGVEVDNSLEAAVCKYCGTPFIVEKAINQYNTHITNNIDIANVNVANGNIDNLIELAKNAVKVNNEQDALKYCEKALELDVKCSEAWYIKMQGERIRIRALTPSIDDVMNIKSIIVAGQNSIMYADDTTKNERIRNVHRFFMESMEMFYEGLSVNASYILPTLKTLASTNKSSAYSADSMTILGYTARDIGTTNFLDEISVDEVSRDLELQEVLIRVINTYVKYQDNYRKRTLLYSTGPNTEAVAQKKAVYEKMCCLLPPDCKCKVSKWTIVGVDTPNSTSSTPSGCYVATCIYNSYDCPQVWTLRRFRDYSLSRTAIGRGFISIYYAVSPTIVRWFGNTWLFRTIFTLILDQFVKTLNKKGFDNTKYEDLVWKKSSV